jgi:hypothetical protein
MMSDMYVTSRKRVYDEIDEDELKRDIKRRRLERVIVCQDKVSLITDVEFLPVLPPLSLLSCYEKNMSRSLCKKKVHFSPFCHVFYF